ncbi:MAG: ATP-binding protein [Planctomycetota bacterium]|nr:ATP-binding protein [Planctomycetota bacterium]
MASANATATTRSATTLPLTISLLAYPLLKHCLVNVDDMARTNPLVSTSLPEPTSQQQRAVAVRILWPTIALLLPAITLVLAMTLREKTALTDWQLAMLLTTAAALLLGIVLAFRRLQSRLLLPALRAIEYAAHSRAIFEASRDGIVVVDHLGRIHSFSPSAETMFGWFAGDIIGHNIKELMPDVNAHRPDPALRRRNLDEGPTTSSQRTVLGRRADGSAFPLSIYVKRISRPGAEPMFCHVFRDQTEQAAIERASIGHARQIESANVQLAQSKFEAEDARAQAEAANRSKSEFLANMSHEIRTPMTAILGFAENLMDPALAQEERHEAVETILRNGDHLMTLIDDILDLSKIEAGKLTIERIDVSPSELLEDVARLMRVRTDAKQLRLSVCSKGPLPATITTDPTRLRQVLINLCGNAIKFTEAGTITLTAQILPPHDGQSLLQIEVRDTGIGMTAQQIATLFRPFTQADSSTTRRFGGTGLGLSISKRLVEMLGGSIDVNSEPGIGSSFTFTIEPGDLRAILLVQPEFLPPNEAAVIPLGKPARATSLLRGHILLAEDGPDNQRLISHLLHKFGVEVTVVADGKSAVDRALAAETGDQPFDLILMDMQMPVMDGYQATGELRSKGYEKPIVALTANTMSGDRERCLAAGCTDFTQKPVERQTLLSVLERLLPHP